MEQNLNLTSKEGNEFEDPTKYRQFMESLIYLTTTKQNISFVVGILFSVNVLSLHRKDLAIK
jgi:hypothetical protein